jgi:hypothetical protein
MYLAHCLIDLLLTLNTEAVRFSETCVNIYRAIRCHAQDDSILENLKSNNKRLHSLWIQHFNLLHVSLYFSSRTFFILFYHGRYTPIWLPLISTSCWLLTWLTSDSEVGGDMFLRSVGWFSTDCTMLYPKRQTSSFYVYFPVHYSRINMSLYATCSELLTVYLYVNHR